MNRPFSISERNLSIAWARVLAELLKPGTDQLHPVVISITCPEKESDIEDPHIRQRLDKELQSRGQNSCNTVANTIFPFSMWNSSAKDDADLLYRRYEKAWPVISKCPANRNGVYFRRLTAYEPRNSKGVPVNQLKFIAKTYLSGNHRKSALQAAVLDPTRDHTNNRQKGFPCLHQVAFTPIDDGGLSVAGFYATQYHFEKAYGNYLGLYRLGRFMAKQLKLRLAQIVCIAAVLDRGSISKTGLVPLVGEVQAFLR